MDTQFGVEYWKHIAEQQASEMSIFKMQHARLVAALEKVRRESDDESAAGWADEALTRSSVLEFMFNFSIDATDHPPPLNEMAMTPETLANLMMSEVKRSACVQYESDEEQGEQPDLTDILVDGHVDFVRLAKTVLSALAQQST